MKYVIHCTLVDVYVRGYCRDNGKYLYTLSIDNAKRYQSVAHARNTIRRLDPVWWSHMEVLKYDG